MFSVKDFFFHRKLGGIEQMVSINFIATDMIRVISKQEILPAWLLGAPRETRGCKTRPSERKLLLVF